MVKYIEGQVDARSKSFGIVVSRFNSLITEHLLKACIDTLVRHGCNKDAITVVWVPGAFEIPLLAKKMATTHKYDAIICLGAVIRGDTPHFEYISSEVAKGIAQSMLECGTPISFGVITADTLEQALERAGAKAGNKGQNAAMAAIETIQVLSSLD
jgi:6,7-dimethyl-8-ribityllumazine synthase